MSKLKEKISNIAKRFFKYSGLLTNLGFWLIRFANPDKDEVLAARLYKIADSYATRDVGLWWRCDREI